MSRQLNKRGYKNRVTIDHPNPSDRTVRVRFQSGDYGMFVFPSCRNDFEGVRAVRAAMREFMIECDATRAQVALAMRAANALGYYAFARPTPQRREP